MADLEDLASAIGEIENAIGGSSVRGDHLFGDLAALGLARDVLENSKAVLLIASSEVPRALYPSARAAFESLFELIFLIGRADFDLMGCKVHVTELAENQRSRGLAQRALGTANDARELEPAIPLHAAIREEAHSWDQMAPGRGDLLIRAYEEVIRERKNGKYYWFGMSRTQMHKAAAPLIGGDTATEDMIKSWYQLLSLQSHPAPRINSHSLDWREDGTFVFGTPDDQKKFSIGMGVGAAHVAAKAASIALRDLPSKGNQSDA